MMRGQGGRIRLGFVPLTDCAPLVIAQEKGWFRQYGLDVAVMREPSWANIRDKMAAGALEGAQMVGAMPLAMSLGLGGIAAPVIVPMTLNVNGNAITVSEALWEQMAPALPAPVRDEPLAVAAALAAVIERRRAAGAPKPVFGTVFPYSSHNYLLRYWLAAGGIDPDRDVQIVTVPPPMMVANLSARHIDGFCVGEPWGQRAVDLGIGRLALSTRAVWANHPEKVLGLSARWVEANPGAIEPLIAALIGACRWLDDSANAAEAARILSAPEFLNAPAGTIAAGITGFVRHSVDAPVRPVADFMTFHRHAANVPWRSHALWTLTQMRRWGQIGADVDLAAVAGRVFRPDLHRITAQRLGLSAPLDESKVEGLHAMPWTLPGTNGPIVMPPDRLLDGIPFDPASPDTYLARLPAFPARDADAQDNRWSPAR